MPGLIRRLWRIAAGLFAVLVILAAVLVGLVRLALVQVPEYRDQVEALAGEALGWPVRIGAMDARLGLRGPELRFTEARVLTHDGERTLVMAATGSMHFETLSLLRRQLRPGTVSLAGVSLRIERHRERRWRLLGEEGPALGEGMPALGGDTELPRLADLPTGTLHLEDVRVEIEDLYRDLGPWEFRVDALELRLGGGRLEFSARGMLPDALGSDLSASAVVTGQDEQGLPRDWTAGIAFTALDLQAIGAAIGRPERLPVTGIVAGSLSAEADGGGIRRLAGDILAHEARPRGQAEGEVPGNETLYESISAAFDWMRTTDGWHVHVNDLEVARAGRHWRSPAASVAFERNEAVRRVEIKADHAELEDLAPLARWLPPAARDRVAQLAPGGALMDVEAHLDLPVDEELSPDVFVKARFERLAVAPGERTPGIRNLSGTISGDLYQGSATFAADRAEVEFPRLFREPLALTEAEAALEWVRDAQSVRLHAPQFALGNEDAAVSGNATLTIPADEGSPYLELEAVAREVRLVAAPAYLPVGIMPAMLVAWLDDALKAGTVDEARVELKGPTRKFPFRGGEGLFKAEFEIAGGELDYEPDWPVASGLDAAVRFENEGMWAQVRAARLLDIEAGPVGVSIPDLAQGMLTVTGEARGELAAFREFVLGATLLEKLLGAGLEPAEIEAGRATAALDLSLPLQSLRDSRARVELQIVDGTVSYGFLGEPLRDIEARLSIDNERVTGSDVSATLAGWPVHADVLVADEGGVRIEARGRLDADGLARVLRMPVETWVSGESDWAGHVQFPAPGTVTPLAVEVASRLEGFAIDLPEPLRKPAADTRHLQVRAEFPGLELMDLQFKWDDSLRIDARVDRSGPEAVLGAVPGAITGEPPGMVFSGAMARLDVGEWLRVKMPGGFEPGGFVAAVAGGRVLVGELSSPLVRLGDVLLELSRADDRWEFGLAADRAAGQVAIPFNLYGNLPVTVRLDHLWLERDPPAADGPAPETPPPGDAPTAMLHPASIPALDIAIGDLRYGGVRFGSVSARVLHEADGIELIGLESIGDGFMLQAEGRSRLSDTVDASRLGVRMSSDNVGATLEFMGFRRSMDAKAGSFDAEVTWQGGLRSDWLSAIQGDASIMIRDGKLVGVEPGAGRVFGLLSIQALPRRLALDFKDVFGEGTSFDRISGDFRFAGGHAITENLVMRGPSADMAVAGRTGLVARDYDQTAVIAADLGRTLPVAGAVVGGPIVGAALYLLTEVLRNPFQAHVTYRLTGSWENPVIEKLGAGNAPARPAPPQARPEEGD